MKTQAHGTVRRLRDDAGDPVGDGFGPMWVACNADCFDPPRYAFRTEEWADAYVIAHDVLATSPDPKWDADEMAAHAECMAEGRCEMFDSTDTGRLVWSDQDICVELWLDDPLETDGWSTVERMESRSYMR